MHQLLEFVTRHWELSLLFIILLSALFYEEAKASQLKDAISPQETVNRMNNQHAKIIDLRSAAEFEENHIKGAVSIPLSENKSIADKIKKWKNNPIILVHSPKQSAPSIIMSLKKQGFENVATLAGGMQEWIKQDLPTAQEK